MAQLNVLTDRRGKDWRWRYGPAAPDGSHATAAVSPLGVEASYSISGRAPVSADDERTQSFACNSDGPRQEPLRDPLTSE